MSATITIDTREFDRALLEYSVASKKDFAETVNRQTKNLAIQGLMLQKEAEQSAIKAVQALEWWPKYIASILSKRGHYTIAQARKKSASVIRSRLVAVKFLKFFFSSLAQAASKWVKGGGSGKSKSFKGFTVAFSPATPAIPESKWVVGYGYQRRSDRTARAAERLLQATLNKAVPATIADMEKYVEQKLRTTGRKHSA